MKIKSFLIAFAVFCILFASNAKAASFTDNQVVSPTKIWTINFSDEVEFDDVTKEDIVVRDGNGNIEAVPLEFDYGNSKCIKVDYPSDGYKPGEKYTLTIGNGVHSAKRKSIKEKVTIHFSIQNNTANYKIGDSIRSPENDDKYEIIDLKQADIDGDSKKEDVILAGLSEDSTVYNKFYLIIVDPETGAYKSYKYIEAYAIKTNTGIHFNDYTGDGIQDIRLNFYAGGNSSDGYPVIFSDEGSELKELDLDNRSFDYTMNGKHIAKVTLHSDNSSYTVDLSKDSSWMKQVSDGTDGELYVGYGPNLKDDKDEDGIAVIKTDNLISGAYHADVVADIATTYKYSKDEQKFVILSQAITSQYPCTKIQSNYLYNQDYEKQNAKIEMKISKAYIDNNGQRYIEGYCYKSLGVNDAIAYERNTGIALSGLYYDESGQPYIEDDIEDVRVSDDFILPVDNNAKFYTFDYYNNLAKKEISFSELPIREYPLPFQVTISNGKVTSVTQEYRP